MGEFRIGIGIAMPAWAPIGQQEFPSLAFAVRRITEAAHTQWVEYAQGKVALPNGKTIQPRTGEYARSILVRETGDFSAEVYSDLAYAKGIEEGMPSRDLKKILSSSLKVRLTRDGRRYLIIPFRHNTPNSVMGNALPAPVYAWWKRKAPSAIVNGDMNYKRKSGTGALDIKTRGPLMVPAWRYKWGSRLGTDGLEKMGIAGKQADRMQGMVMFRKPGGKGRYGSHTQFITFRTMVEGGKGWIAPARPGMYPARTVAEALRPVAQKAFEVAVTEDIQKLLVGS